MPQEPRADSVMPQQTEVAIVGAGPVGLMLANLLGLAGVQVTVLERNDGLLGLPRAIAYDAETLRLFSQVGLYDEIAAGLIQNPHVRHLNARGATLMAADFPLRSRYGHSALGTFYQPDFERVLLKGLSRFANAAVLFEHTAIGLNQDAERVCLRVSTPRGERLLSAAFVIGCDGGASSIREILGVKLEGSTFAERWLVIDAIVRNHNINQITFRCDPSRPSVELPAVGDRVRWEFMQLPGEPEETLKGDDSIHALVSRHAGYDMFEIERRAVYTFHARVADKWRRGRVFLAGDAAHLMPPFAGQGMNGGMKDAVNLAWKLVAVLKGQAASAVLDTYEIERAPVVRKMVDVSRRLGSVILPTSRLAAAMRDSIFACLNLSASFRAFIRRGGVVPPPAIKPSILTGAKRDRLVGQMIPQPALLVGQGSAMLDHLLTCHQWLALGIGVDPIAMLSARDRAILESLEARFIAFNAKAGDSRTLSVQCADADFMAWTKQHNLQAALVRPDRFIADRLDPTKDLAVLTPFAHRAAPVSHQAAA